MRSNKHLVLYTGFSIFAACATEVLAQEPVALENTYLARESSSTHDAVAIGYRNLYSAFSKLRLEEKLSYNYSSPVLDKIKFMTSLSYDFDKIGNFAPYVGIGAGLTSLKPVKFDDLGTSSTSREGETVPTYQINTGILYKSDNTAAVELHLGYSYSSSIDSRPDSDIYSRQAYEVNGHSINAGLSFHF